MMTVVLITLKPRFRCGCSNAVELGARLGAGLLALVLGAGCASPTPKRPSARPAQPTPTASPSAAPAPATHTVSRAPAKPKAQFEAVVEAVEMTPIKLEPKTWTDFTVLEAVPHGARVKKGDLLVRFDAQKLKEQISDLEQDQAVTALNLELAQFELENLEKSTPLKLEAARRAQRNAAEDLAYFERMGRAQREKSAQFNVKSAEQRLESAREELKQLEKMYKADDLTEETEEIILKRQKFAVESAEFSLETTRQQTDWTLKTSIPREAETLKATKLDQDLALALAEQTLPRNLTKKRYDVEKLKREEKKAAKRLADLKADLALMEVRAPRDGLVYYGACENGKWPNAAAVAKKLLPQAKITPNEVFLTILNPDRLVLRAVLQEADLGKVKPGMQGEAVPVAMPETKLPVKLEELGWIPLPGGGFDARLSIQPPPELRLMPGMNCKVALGPVQKSEALLVPKEAVFTEAGQSVVYVLKPNGQTEKRSVKTGEPEGNLLTVTEGLSEGERVLLQKPAP
jgi:multidrug efflux pump subunit AcrA (membrane-fusion protein)